MKEFWLTIKDSKNYEVSSFGNVRNKKTGRVLSPHLNKPGGYQRVNIDGRHRYIHRLVADTFFDGDHDDQDVNHIDGDKENNYVGNLEWCNRSKNVKHAYDNGLKYSTVLKITRCKFCKHRYEYDICDDMPDDFYCGYGEQK